MTNINNEFRRRCHNARVASEAEQAKSEPPADPDKQALDDVTARLEQLRGKRNELVQRILAKTGEIPPVVVNIRTGKISGPSNIVRFRRD